MGERKQINLVVDESQKDRWDAYAENSTEVSSLSHLIRLSVEREIERDGAPGADDWPDVDLSQVDSRFDKLETKIEELSRSVDRMAEREEQESIEELAGEVYDALPRVEDEDEWHARLAEGETNVLLTNEDTTETDLDRQFPQQDNYEAVFDRYVTIAALAETLDVSEYRCRLAVEQVEKSFARVKTHDHEGDTYIYEVV